MHNSFKLTFFFFLNFAGNGNGSRAPTVITILVSVVASLLVVACVGYYYLRKRFKKSKHINIQREDDNEESPTESMRYDFVVIKIATNDFSDTNKLGEGGFGSVYKVIKNISPIYLVRIEIIISTVLA
ncbi:hypothetical protein ACS0TY_028665 [Phlomoides rotata]